MKNYLTCFILILSFVTIFTAIAVEGDSKKIEEYIHNAEKDGWSDDELVSLYQMLPKTSAFDSKNFQTALKKLKLPDEKRPKQFFDAIASYYDNNRGGNFSIQKLDRVIFQVTEAYKAQLKDSQTGHGPEQELAGIIRVKSWKLLQKLQLFKEEMKEKKLMSWAYKSFTLPAANLDWDKNHTITSMSDFQKIVCEGSKSKPVMVKFGSTQCADCMLMEYTQAIYSMAEKNKNQVDVYKIWWGPNLSKEIDELRKKEGALSSPFFAIYRNGQRYHCGYQFPNDAGDGVENCILEKADNKSSGSCGV